MAKRDYYETLGVARGASEAEIKKAMIDAARRVVVVADHGKIGHVGSARIASLDEVEMLITDAAAPAADIQKLEAAGLSVAVA